MQTRLAEFATANVQHFAERLLHRRLIIVHVNRVLLQRLVTRLNQRLLRLEVKVRCAAIRKVLGRLWLDGVAPETVRGLQILHVPGRVGQLGQVCCLIQIQGRHLILHRHHRQFLLRLLVERNLDPIELFELAYFFLGLQPVDALGTLTLQVDGRQPVGETQSRMRVLLKFYAILSLELILQLVAFLQPAFRAGDLDV